MAAAERRRADSTVLSQSQALNQGALQRRATTDLIPSSQPPPLHHQGMHNPMSLPPSLAQPRPELQRSISFPTPPSSASSVMGVGGSDSSFWSGNMVSQAGNGALAIDTVMNSARSMPTTPATTPPGGIQQLQQYPPPPSSLYPPNQQANMNQQGIAQQNMQRFGQPLPQPSQYMSQSRDNNMGPPTSRGPAPTLSRPASRQDDAHQKEDGSEEQNGLAGEGEDHGAQEVHGEEPAENEAEHHQEEYTTHEGNYSNGGHRPSNVYYPPLSAEPHLSPEMNGSPGQGPSTPARPTYGAPNANVPRTVDGGSGATPRTTTTPQQQWVQNGSGYSTPPRTNSANGSAIRQPPQRNLQYQLVGGDPAADPTDATGAGAQDSNAYAAQSGMPMPSQTPPQSYGVNGTATPS
jgi:protein SOK2